MNLPKDLFKEMILLAKITPVSVLLNQLEDQIKTCKEDGDLNRLEPILLMILLKISTRGESLGKIFDDLNKVDVMVEHLKNTNPEKTN
jgi:hypothetical protein